MGKKVVQVTGREFYDEIFAKNDFKMADIPILPKFQT